MSNMNKILGIHGTQFFNFLQWFDMTSHRGGLRFGVPAWHKVG